MSDQGKQRLCLTLGYRLQLIRLAEDGLEGRPKGQLDARQQQVAASVKAQLMRAAKGLGGLSRVGWDSGSVD